MEKRNTHSNENFIKGLGAWMLFECITKIDNLKDFLNYEGLNEDGREDAYRLLRAFSFSIIIEGKIIDMMDNNYGSLSQVVKNKIYDEIIGQIQRNHQLKGEDKDIKAKEILEEQTTDLDHLMITPVIQYSAGYSMGGIIRLADKFFDFPPELIKNLGKFRDLRNYIFHHSTTARNDPDKALDDTIELGKEILLMIKQE